MSESIQDNIRGENVIPEMKTETECTNMTAWSFSDIAAGNMFDSTDNSHNENSISELKMESESSTSISSNSDVSFNIHEMKQEEKRLKRKLQQEEKIQQKKFNEEEEQRERKEKAIKGMSYLLSNSQRYSKFFIDRLSIIKNSETSNIRNRKPLEEVHNNQQQDYIEKAEDKPVVPEVAKKVTFNQPRYFVGTLQNHQIEGLIWLRLLYENGVHGILADEMGLGKTVQIIALVCNMVEKQIPGPFLVVAPLSTLPNWYSEFKRFAPKIPVVIFHGPARVRMEKYRDIERKYPVDNYETAPVVLTSYQVPLTEAHFLKRFEWQYIIIDEGHRIKNFECRLVGVLKSLKSVNRLLLTGTPLQNNLLELWSLLNFLMPQFFQDADMFSSLFVIEDFQKADKIIQQEQNTNIISTIHGVLSPFMLRRLKVDVLANFVPKKEVMVYCPLSDLQRNLYKYILQKNITKLLNKDEDESEDAEVDGRKRRKCTLKVQKFTLPESDDEFDENSSEFTDFVGDNVPYRSAEKESIMCQVKMLNATMMLKKVVNHPYLIQCPVVPGTRDIVINEQIIEQSGKMMVLDAMLGKLKLNGHKVLIFSTLTSLLDLIEDYLHIRGYQYCRIDGRRSLQDRQENIHQFNTDPEKFVFLISTRAGGLGLNLTAADTVILYDRDWNPQADIQAQDRCHRIGQTKPVVVYSFVTKGTVDERILALGTAKRRLEKIVIKKGKFTNPEDTPTSVTDLKELEELLNSVDHSQVIHSNGYVFTDIELNRILDRSDLYAEMEQRKKD